MDFKWLGSFIVDHSNHYYIPIAFFYIPQVRTKVRLQKVLFDRSYSLPSITFEKTRIPNNLEMRKYTAPAPLAGETSQHFAMVYIGGVHAEIPILMTWQHPTHTWMVLLTCWSKFSARNDWSEVLPTVGWWHVISMEFLQLFLRRGKPVVAAFFLNAVFIFKDPAFWQWQKRYNNIISTNLWSRTHWQYLKFKA